MTKPELMKQLIANTFVDLAKANSINKVTIQKIIDTCGISRNTFYYHFDNRAALIVYIFDQGFLAFRSRGKNESPGYLLGLGSFLASEQSLYHKLIKQADERDVLISHIRGLIFAYMTAVFSSLQIEKELPERAVFMLLNSLSYYAYNQITSQVLRKDFDPESYPASFHVEKYEQLFPHLIRFIINYYWEEDRAKTTTCFNDGG